MDKFEKRRAALQALADELGRGGIAQIAKKISKEPSYVSRMLYPPTKSGAKRIGEDTLESLQAAYPQNFGIAGLVASTDVINGERPTIGARSEAAIRETENRRARLRRWIDERFGGVQADFIAEHGLNQGEISSLLKDKSFGSVKARNLETQVGMPDRYLEVREDLGESINTPSPVSQPMSLKDGPAEGYLRLPVMAEASAGPGRVASQEVVQHLDVLESYIRQRFQASPSNIKVLTARGSSMKGVIEDGDVMFVQPTTEFTDDGVYILTLDDLVRVKRLSVSMTTGRVVIESTDGRAPEELPLKEVPHRLHIQGRVLGAWTMRSFS